MKKRQNPEQFTYENLPLSSDSYREKTERLASKKSQRRWSVFAEIANDENYDIATGYERSESEGGEKSLRQWIIIKTNYFLLKNISKLALKFARSLPLNVEKILPRLQ